MREDLKDMTLDNIKLEGQESAPQAELQPDQPQEQSVEQPTQQEEPPTEPEQTSSEPKEEVVEQPVFDWKEKTGGAYDDFDSLWNDFQAAKETTTKEPENPFKDDFIKEAVEYYNKTGDLTPYLEAKTVNYDEMSDEDIIKRDMRKEYPNLDDKTFDRLFNKQLQKKYSLNEDEFDEEDVQLGKALLKNDAQKLREKYKEEQAKFAAPTNDTTQQEQELAQQWEKMVNENDYVKTLQKEGKFEIQYGDEKFTYELDNPQEIVGGMIDEQKIFQNFIDQKDGKATPNFERYAKTLAFSKDPSAYEKRLIEYGKSLGKGDVLDELENPTEVQTPNRKQPGASGSGDWREEFFQQVKSQFKR